VQTVGRLRLDANPTNFFAEVEQVAFHLGHLPPGIDVTNDPLLQARLFSYLDTQLTRLAGPNFHQIPINRPHCPVNDMLRDGFHQQAVHGGVAPYRPNSLDGGNPFPAGDAEHAFLDVPVTVTESSKVRASPVSFADHYSQARLFWRSMSGPEREHIIRAYAFELGKCYEQVIKERQLACLANVDPVLCAEVAMALGLPTPEPSETVAELAPSPALSQIGQVWPVDGRVIGIVADPGAGLEDLAAVRQAVFAAGMVPLLIAPHGGMLGDTPVQRTFATARSVEFDALLVACAPPPAPDAIPARDAKAGASDASTVDPRVLLLVEEAWRHAKAIGAWGTGSTVVATAGIAGSPGVVSGGSGTATLDELLPLLGEHRVWARFPATV
jgi:catalase